ncbi:MAG: isoprenylcysteine carboxylmethyltransferase family protein [Chloroflexota bacterium]
MSASQPPRNLTRRALMQIVVAIAAIGAMLFVPAGTFLYWEAWLYLAIVFIPMSFVTAYFLRTAPALVERRMRMKEKEAEQKLIIKLSWVYFLVTFLLPGLDRRFEWSSVPAAAVIVADIIILVGFGLFYLVAKENQYASRIIEVEQQHEVVTTGPYTLVRHPMYLAALVVYVFSPLALGSYWAMIPTVLFPAILVARILNEERVLLRELKGYREYMEKTRYRLIPGLW